MFVCVMQNCLEHPELVKRLKMLEVMGDNIILVASGSVGDAQVLLDQIGCDWDILYDQEPVGYDLLVGAAFSEECGKRQAWMNVSI